MAIPIGKDGKETFADYESLKKSTKEFKDSLKPPMQIPWTLIGAVVVVLVFLFWGRF